MERVRVWPGALAAMVVGAKVSVVGDQVNAGAASPEPESATETDATPRLVELTVTIPLCSPAERGENVTGTEQLAAGARLVAQVPEPTLKGDAVAKASPVRVPVPGLLT